jgi:hypothetical protein
MVARHDTNLIKIKQLSQGGIEHEVKKQKQNIAHSSAVSQSWELRVGENEENPSTHSSLQTKKTDIWPQTDQPFQ